MIVHDGVTTCPFECLHLLQEFAVRDVLPANGVDVISAVNQPDGWRGGIGKLAPRCGDRRKDRFSMLVAVDLNSR